MTMVETSPEEVEETQEVEEVEEVEETQEEVPSEDSLSNHDIAQEVIAGHWGRGNDRKRRLQAAGYNVDEVYSEMVKIFNR